MTEYTTIQVTKEQVDKLKARRLHDDEALKSVVGRLLDQPGVDDLADEIAEQVAQELQ